MTRPHTPLRSALFVLSLVLGAAACTNDAGLYGPDWRAEEDFARAADRVPTARTLHSLAAILASKGQDQQAQMVLARLLYVYPKYVPAYNDMAALHLRHDRPDSAVAALNSGLKLQPNDAVLVNNLGMCYLLGHDYVAALGQFEKAAELAPWNNRYKANCAVAAGLSGDLDRSRHIYAAFLEPEEVEENMAILERSQPASAQETVHAVEATIAQEQAAQPDVIIQDLPSTESWEQWEPWIRPDWWQDIQQPTTEPAEDAKPEEGVDEEYLRD